MSDRHHQPHHRQLQRQQPDELGEHLADLAREIEELKELSSSHFLSGEIEFFRFDGKAGKTSFTDDHGSNCLSYAVYNPNDFRVFVGWGGRGATQDALVIPKQKLVVAPLTINGYAQLAADAAQLAEGKGTIIRVRFPVAQPFFVGALT